MKTPNQLYNIAIQYVKQQIILNVAVPIALSLYTSKPAGMPLEQRLPDTRILPPDPENSLYQMQEIAQGKAACATLITKLKDHLTSLKEKM